MCTANSKNRRLKLSIFCTPLILAWEVGVGLFEIGQAGGDEKFIKKAGG